MRANNLLSSISFIYLCFLFPALLFGQSDRNGDRRITGTYYISNTTLIPSPGKILTGQQLLFENGIIKALGKNIDIPAEAQEIKGDSLLVYPGFIDVANKTGMVEPTIPEKPDDFDPSEPLPEIAGIHPHFSAVDHYQEKNPHDQEWRKLGFTIAQKLPKGKGMLPGNSALVIYGHESRNNILSDNQSLYFKFSTVGGVYPNTDLGVMAKWRDLLQNARLYETHGEMYSEQSSLRRRESNPVLDALIPVINREIPVLIESSSELDIRRALKMQEENNFDLIITGINEGDALLPILKEKKTSAVLTLDLPDDKFSDPTEGEKGPDFEKRMERTKNAYLKSLSLAGEYEKAGIPFGFTTKHLSRTDFIKNIRLMIANGLSEEGALAALTVNPAEILQISAIAGTLSEGKMANMVLMSDTLFSEEAKVVMVISDGYLFDYSEKAQKIKDGASVWEYEAETEGRKSKGKWKFTKEDNNWSGTVSYDDPQTEGVKTSPIKNAVITEKSLAFTFSVEVGENALEVKVSGEVTGEKFSGNMEIKGYGNYQVKAKKLEKPEIK
ncbi:amidohydrolase family protein [Cyclobacterium plantarum]|uniref:Amidohydrolase family protein n=1 Tax=Cyclobacterium plantarum TaxID=2716263 RepID=A0ABX0HAW7_9BACT|nr:amidohydrolase family protein [Cyclobacterium plantarum]NHE57469.1 amidohydrolase family protein [Cyclobacterium plantarum]